MTNDDRFEQLQMENETLRCRITELVAASQELEQLRTAQAAMLKSLEREQEFTRVLLENLAEGVVACDADGTLRLFNRTSRQWHGLEAKPLLPEEWASQYDLYRLDGRTPLPTSEIPLFRALLGEHIRDAGMAIAVKGQSPRLILSSGDPLFDSAGKKLGAVVVMHDITARKQAEDSLRTSEAELRAALHAVTDSVFVTDRRGRYLKIAPTRSVLPTLSRPELIGKTLAETLPRPTADSLLEQIGRALDTGAVATASYPSALTDGGEEVWVAFTVSPLPDGTVFIVARDITERHQVEDVLRRSLANSSMPLIPISDEIVVMPLIGVIDAQRAQQVMTTLLSGIVKHRAQVAILDITGIAMVDTQVANGLIQAARAASLLGAQVVTTGIRPEVAEALVELGADLSAMVTRSTLQSGIAFAMGLTRSRPVKR
jgi:PAS domain S-box-containing protein